MDLNGDGFIDVLSGSFSAAKSSGPSAGLFQVLYGDADGQFKKPQPLMGSDDEALVIYTDSDETQEHMCTRAFAADLDGDGQLDIVSGNRAGTFALFYGEGAGAFDPTSTRLKDPSGEPLSSGGYSDPYLVDWDADGDLDLLSGGGAGGVWLFTNQGTKTNARFAAGTRLVEPPAPDHETIRFGEDHLTGPQSSTRIAVADIDGDGTLDLLVGDTTTIVRPAEGLTETQARERLVDWQRKLDAIRAERPELGDSDSDEEWEIFDAWQTRSSTQYRKRSEFLDEAATGSVWLIRGKG